MPNCVTNEPVQQASQHLAFFSTVLAAQTFHEQFDFVISLEFAQKTHIDETKILLFELRHFTGIRSRPSTIPQKTHQPINWPTRLFQFFSHTVVEQEFNQAIITLEPGW